MSGGGPIRIPSTMMPPALDDCMATPPALISHDDSDDVGTLLRLERRTERPRTPASYTRADEPGNKPRSRRRPPRPCSIAYSATATPISYLLPFGLGFHPHITPASASLVNLWPISRWTLLTARYLRSSSAGVTCSSRRRRRPSRRGQGEQGGSKGGTCGVHFALGDRVKYKDRRPGTVTEHMLERRYKQSSVCTRSSWMPRTPN